MSRAALVVFLAPALAYAEDAASVATGSGASSADDLDLRLTLSSFLYREVGKDAPPLVDQGAPLENASPVRRYFGDLRVELSAEGLHLDVRVRQTASQRFQSGTDGGGEYDLRTVAYQLGGSDRALVLGRQYIDGAGGSKLDGVAFRQRVAKPLIATLYAGAFPVVGSRSIDADYPVLQNEDGSEGDRLIPLAGGFALGITTDAYHGDLGLAAVYIPQDVPMATTQESSRVFATTSGFLRAGSRAEVHHFALVDIAGQTKATLTNGSLGATLHPGAGLQLTASVHHVSVDTLQIAARNLLDDPDPATIGLVQNNVALLQVSQDAARAGASLALARQRFEISLSGGIHRRPEVDVALADGTGAIAFPEQRSLDATMSLLDRRSIAGLRLSIGGTLTQPLRDTASGVARGTVVRIAGSRAFARDRGQLELDATAGRFRTLGDGGGCTSSLDPLPCYGASTTTLLQAGALLSWRVSREWLVLADLHLGSRAVSSTTLGTAVSWPTVYTVTGYVRLQWRFH